MNNLITITLFLLFILNSNNITTSFADETDVRYYDVEIIVFENTRPKYSQSEFWKKNIVQPEPETYVQIGQPIPFELPEIYDPLLTFQFIENTAYRLNDIVSSLNESNFHKVLLHSAWRQPGMSKENALSVKIYHQIPPKNSEFDGSLSSNRDTLISKYESEQQSNSFGNSNNTTTETNQIKNGFLLSGYIKLILSRYLHLKIDLSYQEQKKETTELFISDEFGEDFLLPNVFHISQTRRLRSKELHYIDHPVISIIALITPYKVLKQD